MRCPFCLSNRVNRGGIHPRLLICLACRKTWYPCTVKLFEEDPSITIAWRRRIVRQRKQSV